MKRRNMFKGAMVTALAGAMAAGMAMTSFAAGWQQDANGWWYGTNADNSTWYQNGWHWIDGDGDGVAECYFFDGYGYIFHGTTTPDGYTVNADGAWVQNGVVQTQQVQQSQQTQQTQAAASSQSVQALCAAAQDMTNGTRESNAKYGEVKVVGDPKTPYRTFVTYANGLTMMYFDSASAGWGDAQGDIQVFAVTTPVEAPENPKVSEYGTCGISMAALDMHKHTRAENAKYGEVAVRTYTTYVGIDYANGLHAKYYLPNSGKFYEMYGEYPDGVSTDVPKWLFKEDIAGRKYEDILHSLQRKGYDAYHNGWVTVKLPAEIGWRLEINELDEYGRQFVKFY